MASNSKLLLYSTGVSSTSLVISDVPNPETIDLQFLSTTIPAELTKNTPEDYLKSQAINNALSNGWIRIVSQPIPDSDPIPVSAQYNEFQSYLNKSNKIVLNNTSDKVKIDSKNGVDVQINVDDSAPVEFTLTCQAASTLNQTGIASTFMLSSRTTDYYVMFNVAGVNTDPVFVRRTKIEIEIATDDTASIIASKIVTAFSNVVGMTYTVTLDPLDNTKVNFKSVSFGYIEHARHSGNLTWTFATISTGLEEFRVLDASGTAIHSISEYNNVLTSASQDTPFYSRACNQWTRKTQLGALGTHSSNSWFKIADVFLTSGGVSNELIGDFTLTRPFSTALSVNHGRFTLNFKLNNNISSSPLSYMLLEQSGDYDGPMLRGILTENNLLEKRLELYLYSPTYSGSASGTLYLDIKGAASSLIRIPLQLRTGNISGASLPAGTIVPLKYRNMMLTQDVFTGPLNLKSTTAPVGNPPAGEVYMWNESGKIIIRDSAGVNTTLNP